LGSGAPQPAGADRRGRLRELRHRGPVARRLGAAGFVASLLLLASAAWGQADDPPSVAVLPFRVHSAKPIDYLGESLSNLIRARLEASGELRVLDPDDVAARLPADPEALRDDAALRSVATDLAIDYVVSGSLTELAGRYSLDVRVTPASEALRSHTLVLTAERDDELLARVNELADGVVEHVAGGSKATVVRVEVVGAGDLEEELRARLRTRDGEGYDAAAVRDDLADLRSEPAVARARAETVRDEDGVVVRFSIVRADRLLVQPSAERAQAVVAEVRVRGNRRIEADAILARIATRAGGPYSASQIAKDVREVHSLGFFRNVRVLSESTPSGRIVIFEVEENPVVREISISGNDNVDSDKIRDVLTLTTGSTLDLPLLFGNRSRIEQLYRAEGYYLAEVETEIEPLSESSVSINFHVEEGKKLKLRSITFKGNTYFDDAELLEGFRTKRWRWWSYATSWFDRSGTFSEPLFVQDLRSVEKLYTDAGFIHVQIGEPNVIPSPDGLEVSVSITEGEQFRTGKIDVMGDDTVDVEELRAAFNLQQGDIFNRSHLTEDVADLTERYTNQGFFYASVTPLSNVSDADRTVDIVFQVRKGPLYFIREIDISGNTITVDPVIRREVQVVEGQLYSQRALQLSRARIERLGFFEEVDFQIEPTEHPEQVDLEISVVERPTGSFSFGAGFSSQDGFVGTGSLATTNLFGRGYAANFSADIGTKTQRFFLNFVDPYFLATDFELAATIFSNRVRFESFDQDQLGATLFLGHALSEDNRTRGTAIYSWANRELDESTNVTAASVILREIFGGAVTTSMLGLSFTSDRRDDRLAPTSGFVMGGSIEGAGLGGFSRFFRVEGRMNWYLGAPRWLLERSTFVVGARFGYALPFNKLSDFDFPDAVDLSTNGSILPLDEIDDDLKLPLSGRYFLGGLGTFQLRGFKARSVGPRRAILYELTPGSGQFLPVGTTATPISDVDGQPTTVDDPDFSGTLGAVCTDQPGNFTGGNGNGKCNSIDDDKIDDFEDLDETDVIGGNKFISTSFEYRFPISETLGLQGLVFFDTGNAFAEGDNLFDVTEWRYGTGVGVQWFSPFGPLGVVMGFPLDKLSVEDSPVFEFSVGGRDF
jgi:outer membrane protein insertion porin family